MRRLRLLAVSSEPPWPLDTGGHLRTFHLLRALGRLGEVTLVAPRPAGAADVSAVLGGHGVHAHLVPVTRTVAGEARRACAGLLRGEPYVFYHRHHWPAVRRALAEGCRRERPDVVYLDHLDSLVYRDVAAGRPTVLDLHNVYSVLAARSAAGQANPLMAWALRGEARRLAAAERRGVAAVDLVTAVSDDDARLFARHARRVAVVPNGVDCAAYADLPTGRRASGPPRLLFVGALSWPPNVAAARALADEVLPGVRERVPHAVVDIVGRSPSPDVLALARRPGVEVHADVPDVRPFLARASVLVVPLDAGGGTRLKILEAFAAGLPVVSTPVGCEGLDVRDGTHLLIGQRQALAALVVDLLQSPPRATALAAAGRARAMEAYDWTSVGARAASAIEETVEAWERGRGAKARGW